MAAVFGACHRLAALNDAHHYLPLWPQGPGHNSDHFPFSRPGCPFFYCGGSAVYDVNDRLKPFLAGFNGAAA
jgi:hypothetical protein